jgi:hypothetical protein
MDSQNLLTTIVQVAATFIGFTGIIFAIGKYSQGGWNDAERAAVLHLLLPSIAALFLAFLPILAASGIEAGPGQWRLWNLLSALVHLPMVTNAARLKWRGQLIEPVPISNVLVPGGNAVILTNFIVVAGVLQRLSVTIFAASLVWFLLISSVQLALLILTHTRQDR